MTPEPSKADIGAVLFGAESPPAAPPNPDAATDAVDAVLREDGPKMPPHFPAVPPTPAPKRRTKAELETALAAAEAEKARLEAAAAIPEAAAIARAPLALTFRAVFAAVAGFRGPHWALAETESAMLAEAWAPVVGPAIQNHPEAVIWAGALAATYSVIGPRVAKDKEAAEKQEASDGMAETKA